MRYFSGRAFLKLKDQLFEYKKVIRISSYQPETPRTSADLAAQLLHSPVVYVIPVQQDPLPSSPAPEIPSSSASSNAAGQSTPASTTSSRLKRSTARPVT